MFVVTVCVCSWLLLFEALRQVRMTDRSLDVLCLVRTVSAFSVKQCSFSVFLFVGEAVLFEIS